MRNLRNIALGLVLLFATTFPAWAGSITWDLSGVTSSDGAIYSGSFVFNADTGIYSSIDIVSTGGSLTPADTYTYQVPSVEDNMFLVPLASPPAVGVWLLNLEFTTGLTDAGGTIPIALSSAQHTIAVGTCMDAACTTFHPVSDIISGSVVAQPSTPEPGTFVLLGSAVLLLAVFGKRLLGVF